VTLQLTGHCRLIGRISKLRCLERDDSAIHVLCGCEATARFGFLHLGLCLIESGGYTDAPLIKILPLFLSVGFLREIHNRSITDSRGAQAASLLKMADLGRKI
jgi:hypothetical protein